MRGLIRGIQFHNFPYTPDGQPSHYATGTGNALTVHDAFDPVGQDSSRFYVSFDGSASDTDPVLAVFLEEDEGNYDIVLKLDGFESWTPAEDFFSPLNHNQHIQEGLLSSTYKALGNILHQNDCPHLHPFLLNSFGGEDDGYDEPRILCDAIVRSTGTEKIAAILDAQDTFVSGARKFLTGVPANDEDVLDP